MGKDGDKDRKPQPCPARTGQGGYWEWPNGAKRGKMVWRQCRMCNGRKFL